MPILTGPPTTLQSTVDRFAQSLRVPASLHSLHPGTSEMPYRALRPAMVLCTISAFEGFAEEMLSAALQRRGDTLYQISEQVNFTNPDLSDVEKKMNDLFGKRIGTDDPDFSLEVWRQPVGDSGWWGTDVLSWENAKEHAMTWMHVRHALSHGAVSGWGSELWPGTYPAKKRAQSIPPASTVLRETENGRYSLAKRCAVNCCRIYRYGAQGLANRLARLSSEELDWTKVPEFNLE